MITLDLPAVDLKDDVLRWRRGCWKEIVLIFVEKIHFYNIRVSSA
jgi:hypothetical protein